MANFVILRDPCLHIYTDASIYEGGFVGVCWVIENHRHPTTPNKPTGMAYALPGLSKDITLAELKGILSALQFVAQFAEKDPSNLRAGVRVVVHSDCLDAVNEVRYAEGGHCVIPLAGGREGYIGIAHPDVTPDISSAIRSLQNLGIIVHVLWRGRNSNAAMTSADEGARFGAVMKVAGRARFTNEFKWDT